MMPLGNKIAFYRKKQNITQEALARQLGVTNQAVSKWESDHSCPDVMLLPKIAEVFGISIDELFGRESTRRESSGLDRGFDFPQEAISEADNIVRNLFSEEMTDNIAEEPADHPTQNKGESGFETMFGISLAELDKKANQRKRAEQPCPGGLPWEDDNVLRVVLYVGRKMVGASLANSGDELSLDQEVEAILSCISVTCGNVCGDVDAGSYVVCGDVGGDVDAGTDVHCGNVCGDVDAGCCVDCTNVEGDIDAGGAVTIRR